MHSFIKISTIIFVSICLVKSKYVSNVQDEDYDGLSKIRTRRGLVDVGVDLNLLGNLLNTNVGTTAKNKIETTTVPATTTTARTKTTTRANINNRFETAPQCGSKKVVHTELIRNGLSTKPGDWPWHVALYKLQRSGAKQQYICGGSLVSETRVVTAAHCVMEVEDVILPERLFATLGKYNMAGSDAGSQTKNVFDIIVHEDFNKASMVNDLAILMLSSKVKYSQYIQPICLWSANNLEKSEIVDKLGTIVGWGFNEEDKLSDQLMKAEVPVVSDLVCIKSNPSFFSRFITEKTFCAGFRNGTSACNGDSGGGMYFPRRTEDGQNIWYLRGIISLSVSREDRNLCDSNEYTVFTDSAQYNQFITNNL